MSDEPIPLASFVRKRPLPPNNQQSNAKPESEWTDEDLDARRRIADALKAAKADLLPGARRVK